MELAAVMDEVAELARTVLSLSGRTTAYPAAKINPPAGVVGYPDSLDPHGTYNGGIPLIKGLPLWVVVGRVTERTARDQVSTYCADSGPESLVAALESGPFDAFDELTVVSIEFDTYTANEIDYLAALFNLDIAGSRT